MKRHLRGDICRFCFKLTKKKCIFCGFKLKKILDMTSWEKLEYESHKSFIEGLLNIYNKMRSMQMVTTNCDRTDVDVERYIGDWTTNFHVSYDRLFLHLVTVEGYPKSDPNNREAIFCRAVARIAAHDALESKLKSFRQYVTRAYEICKELTSV